MTIRLANIWLYCLNVLSSIAPFMRVKGYESEENRVHLKGSYFVKTGLRAGCFDWNCAGIAGI